MTEEKRKPGRPKKPAKFNRRRGRPRRTGEELDRIRPGVALFVRVDPLVLAWVRHMMLRTNQPMVAIVEAALQYARKAVHHLPEEKFRLEVRDQKTIKKYRDMWERKQKDLQTQLEKERIQQIARAAARKAKEEYDYGDLCEDFGLD